MALEFVEDAICLSGLTGSKLKCEVIGQYYSFWWKITSGGPAADYAWDTSIVELDAATGEVFIEDTQQTVLGSSGHALDLKCGNPNTRNLRVILVEKDAQCYSHLKRVIGRRWSSVDLDMAEGSFRRAAFKVHLLNENLDVALDTIQEAKLGNALFFFDPLRSVEYKTICEVASRRMLDYYATRTEFIVFLFTSDWFLGRAEFAPLPINNEERRWSPAERATVDECDALFGDASWRSHILNDHPIARKEQTFIRLYTRVLQQWFRYVLPMPFNPKSNQVFHLMLCSNFETGVRATRDFFCGLTCNPKYSPDNRRAFTSFRTCHPTIFSGLKGSQRPIHWHFLWRAIKDHEGGLCDRMCRDYVEVDDDPAMRQQALDWLEAHSYLKQVFVDNAWGLDIPQYTLNWATIQERLGIAPPPELKPLSMMPRSLEDIGE